MNTDHTHASSRLSTLHTDPASGLAYRQLEADDDTRPSALLVLLHGVGGNESQLLGLAHRLPRRIQVVLARGPQAFGPTQFGWFQVTFGPQGPSIDAAQAEDSRRRLLQLIGSLQATLDVAPGRTVVAGFSQGGIMSAGVALTAPQLLHGFGLLSGRILPEIAPLIGDRQALARLAGLVMHGEYDDKLPISWADKADAWLGELGVPHETRRYRAGHELNQVMAGDFVTWLDATLP